MAGTKESKKLQVGVNILKNKVGIFSEDRIKIDQISMPENVLKMGILILKKKK